MQHHQRSPHRAVIQMYRAGSSYASGSRSATRRHVDYGRTYVVRPKGRHRATIVWLHGLGDNGASWYQLLETLPLPNIKWICPTAPTRPVSLFGFDIADPSQDGPDDADGLEASAAHIANLLSSEPADGIAFDVSIVVLLVTYTDSTGIPSSLPPSDRYSTTWNRWVQYGCRDCLVFCFLLRTWKIRKWSPISHKPQCGRWSQRLASLFQTKVESSQEAARRAASLPLLLCHGTGDGVVPYKQGERSAETLRMSGFRNLTFEAYNGLEHYTIPEEMNAVCKWLTARLQLDGSRA
ncbi:hypothetical protein C4D60_Mb06t03000 [Musa balbisiana]|uniref:Phospholipase/carboxylesterase/thioesterase domain-containing protein n=1 Tax=Musa balbisiana TaxID=52838 RepID=A0A4S8IK68_MUSBA|nr:hypothetical protein C4D60_Mb06t03000 [Musa balbisiana]